MRKIFALVIFLIFAKCSFSQGYPLTQVLGSDSTIVVSKGALQSRLINVTFVDTFAANNQRIRQYPGAQIATTSGGINLWVRNANATAWLPINTGSGNNIYTINGTLTGNRTLTGGGYPLTFTGLDKFVVSADSVRFTTGDLKFGLNTDSASLTKKISYSGNYRGDYKQFTLVDKGYVDSVVASSPAGTVTSIATNNGSGITGGTITSSGTLAIDTTNVISTKANVTSGLAGKLNISDTAAMLNPYLRKVDTASLSNRINQKLNISDTASMLGNYINNVGYGLSKAGQVVLADSATLSAYYLRRKDSLTATNSLGYVTKKILADTAAAIRASDAGGSVTSVSTNNGTGITGGTITTSGTLAIDTTLISTRAWRQKGIDSVANLPRVTSVGLTMPVAFNVAGSPVTSSGTLAVTAAGLATQYIRGDGQLANYGGGGGGGGGASVSYYLNGSVNQGTFVGNTYYQMNKTPVIGAGTNFTIAANGYIAQFITNAGDPALLNIPAGNWNFEMYFSASSAGGNPQYYVELYKYNGTAFTLIASSAASPESITGGTVKDLYLTSLAIPATSLTLTDRLAVRVYVLHDGRTITLHTEDQNLCQVITTFTTGITALNGLTEQVQYFATGTSGTDFNISSTSATHTFNLPTASATNRGALSTTDWTTFNNKVGGSLISGYIPKATGTNTIDTSQLFQNGQNVGIGTLTPNGRLAIVDTGGFALRINYNSASNVSDSNAAIYAENNGLSSYVAIFNEKTTNNTGAQLPLLIESSLTTGTPQANMGTGVDFGTRDDANNRKLNRFIIRGTDPAAATYTSRAEFRLWNAGSQTTPYYWLGNGNMGLGTSTPDSNLTVVNGAYFQRGIRASGLPAAPGTKALRIDASGTLSYADTLIDAGGTVTSVATNNGTGITGGTITTSGTLAIDTTLISTRAWRQKGIDSLQANINLKLNISDTASMLSPYLRSNTAAATYVPQTRTITINGTTQDLTANRTYNVGTVTSVATNTGTGITGGTFTTSGTIAADTLLLSTRAWRQKGVDSLQANINTKQNTLTLTTFGTGGVATLVGATLNIPQYQGALTNPITGTGTANYVAKFSGFTGITNSQIFDNSTNVGIGTATPDSLLTVNLGTHFKRGVRMSGLPTAPGTRALRVDANGTLSVSDTLANGISGSGTTNYIPKFTSSSAIGNSNLINDASGNLGLGVTPSAWRSTNPAFQLGQSSSLYSYSASNITGLGSNVYINSSGNEIYIANGTATTYTQNINGEHRWNIASSGTAGNVISFTQAMTLDADGDLGIGTTNPGYKLDVNGTGRFSNSVTFASGVYNYIGTNRFFLGTSGTYNYLYTGSTALQILNQADVSALVTILDGGNVGIGTTSPSYKLDILNSANAHIARFTGGASSNINIGIYASNALGFGSIGTQSNHGFNIYTNDIDRISITSGGNVGIGTTSPAARLDVRVPTESPATGAVALIAGTSNGANDIFRWFDGTTQLGVFKNSGNVGIGTTIPRSTLEIVSGNENTNGDIPGVVSVVGANKTSVSNTANVLIATNDIFGIDIGGSIGFGGRAGGNTQGAFFAGIAGRKEVAASFDVAGYLQFVTRNTAGTSAERMRITSGGNVGINTQTPNSNLDVAGSIAAAYASKTATYTLTSSDYTVVFNLNGNATANLPDATTCKGRIYVIKINATNVSDVLTIDPNGAQTIDGNATYGLQCQQAITIQSDGSNWRIIADYALGLNCL